MKILSHETVYKAHVFDVEKVRIEFPDGHQKDYDFVRHGEAVVVVPVTTEGRILFVRQERIGAFVRLCKFRYNFAAISIRRKHSVKH